MAEKDLRRALALLQAGDWQAAHLIVQEDEDSRLACWAHGIVHLMEGDVPNARYWYRVAGRVLRRDFSVEAEIAALSDTLKG
ncbi:MAG TPA: hypothetical protein VEX61_00680 [Burkholderiales bacterium]|nr:hypothetical protein [Burkholderiales bacterium]